MYHSRLYRRWFIYSLGCVCGARAEMAGVEPSQEPPEMRGVTAEQVVILAGDALFLFVGVVYGSRVLAPKPMTYLSEIAFPLDFCVKLAASFMLFLLNGLQLLYQEIFCSWLLYHRPFGRDQQNVVAMMETLVWGMSSSILWMEYRRGLTPSVYLRLFWFFKWLDATYFLITNGTFAEVSSTDDESAMSYMTGMVFGGVCYAASAVLVLFICVRPTTVTPEFISYPTEVNTPSAYLNSAHCQPPTSWYGSFKDWELVAYPSSAKSTEERAILDITIPATTSSIWGNKQFVSFKIVVQTDEDHWTLRRPYSDFAALDEELPEEVRADCPLPPEEYDDRKVVTWKERPRSLKSRLEKYLKQVLHHPKLAPYASQALCEFLEMEYVEDIASVRSYHSNSII
ncbi:hypothetical protein PF002_g1192 [Phytophthora fragariae]|nr:hypothetical protein PF009_g2307 [Phytophthora fragariae]KAE9153709.1 hypothetical protein PF006_g2177 [Phytophthora fragariae]KAE9257267.1 hypothetical protein PF002_g1192 [Phytophthora fragariae]KAE9320820.1 hypothetical protein PF001_g5217 [Phytophthora fragariae]